MKDFKTTVREYAQSISEGQLEVLTLRLTQKLQGDVAHVLDVLSGDRNIDMILSSARTSDDFFHMIDQITQVFQGCRHNSIESGANSGHNSQGHSRRTFS